MNEVVAIIVASTLAMLSVAVLVFPFLRPRTLPRRGQSPDGAATVSPELEAAYEAIRTLELEHDLGKVPEEVYREQLQAYRVQAAALLREEDHRRAEDAAQSLDRGVLADRTAVNGSHGVTAVCPECSFSVNAGSQTCPQCHTDLSPAGLPAGGGPEA